MAPSTELILTPPAGVSLAALDAVPALRAAFARGPVATSRLRGEAWWFARFGLDPAVELPGASLRDAAGAADGWRLCADPVHLHIAGDAVVLDADAVADLALDEARALAARLSAHFAEDGLAFEVIGPREWLLRCRRRLEARTHPCADAHGRSIETLLPDGPDARTLKRIINEAQMLLFDAPENRSREARGAAPANGLWLWGGAAARPPIAPIEGLRLASDTLHRRGLAEAAGGIATPLHAAAPETAGPCAGTWIDLDARGATPDAWLEEVRTWLGRLSGRAGRATVSLRLPDGTLGAPLFARDWLAPLRRGGIARAARQAGLGDPTASAPPP